jgi:hypothetical protein
MDDHIVIPRAVWARGICFSLRAREKQIPLFVPRSPNCGGQEKARNSVRDDSLRVDQSAFPWLD